MQDPLPASVLPSSDSVLLEIDWYDPAFDIPARHTSNNSLQQRLTPPLSSSTTQLHDSSGRVEANHSSYIQVPPSMPLAPRSRVRSLTQRTAFVSKNFKIVNLLLQNLKAYPLMMLRYSRLPPFIHPHSTACCMYENEMEPLDNCINLMRMIGSDLRGGRKLFWRNVQVQCERLCADVSQTETLI